MEDRRANKPGRRATDVAMCDLVSCRKIMHEEIVTDIRKILQELHGIDPSDSAAVERFRRARYQEENIIQMIERGRSRVAWGIVWVVSAAMLGLLLNHIDQWLNLVRK